ncbi:MAG: hypothetical protein KOO60_07835 [Gemmatimonadales bacterium]|nr:hypothetical protein [Gemmatimonadales bacterium]
MTQARVQTLLIVPRPDPAVEIFRRFSPWRVALVVHLILPVYFRHSEKHITANA